MRMHQFVICGLPRSIVFSHIISQKAQFSKKKIIEHKMCFLFSLQLLSETFLMLRRTGRDVIKMCISLRVKYPLFLSDLSETYFLLDRFSKDNLISNCMKTRPMGAELFPADG